MTHKNYTKTPLQRRLFFWSLVVSCLTMITVVVFFSRGYRFSFVHDIFIYAGSISVKSVPRAVEVYIDDKKPSNRHLNLINNSYHITGIRHGMHNVRFGADGYKEWQKNIRIHSGIATEFWNIVLVKNFYERTLYDVIDPTELFFAPQHNLLAYIKKSEGSLLIPIVNVETNELESLVRDTHALFAEEKKENVEWSPDTQLLIIPVLRTHETVTNEVKALIPPTEVPRQNITPTGVITAVTDEHDVLEDTTEELVKPLDVPRNDYMIATRKVDRNIESVYFSTLLPPQFFTATTAQSDTTIQEVAADTPFAVEATEEEPILLDDALIYPDMHTFRFHPKKERVIYGIIDHNLYTFDLSAPTLTSETMLITQLSEDVLTYDLTDDGIFVLTKQGVLLYDKNYDFTDPQALTGFGDIDEENSSRIIAYDKNRVLHISASSGALTVFNKDGTDVYTRKLGEGIVHARFSNDGKKILYHDARTISLYMTREWDTQPFRDENTIYTITTFTSPIDVAEWTSDYEHVIIGTEGTLVLVDLDQRFGANQTTITERRITDNNVIINHGTNQLFFTDNVSDYTQLFSIDFPEKAQTFF